MAKIIDLRPRKIIPRLGFVIQDPVVLHHYENVLQHFNKNEVELILHQPQRYPELASWAAQWPFKTRNSAELLTLREGYQVLVSNHYIGLLNPIPYVGYAPKASASLIRLLGNINVRFMYGLGAESWNLAPWNHYYDHFLCQGPRQSEALNVFSGTTWPMGYPRYDPLFNTPIDRNATLEQWGSHSGRPVILYLPTLHTYGGTLQHYGKLLSSLEPEYQVIIKPHPLAWTEELESVQDLDSFKLSLLIKENIDNLKLLQLADYVICDCGGSAFSALYTDKNLLLLDRPDYLGQMGHSEQYLRQFISGISPINKQQISVLLNNHKHWQEQKKQRERLRQEFFYLFSGRAAEQAESILRAIFNT